MWFFTEFKAEYISDLWRKSINKGKIEIFVTMKYIIYNIPLYKAQSLRSLKTFSKKPNINIEAEERYILEAKMILHSSVGI